MVSCASRIFVCLGLGFFLLLCFAGFYFPWQPLNIRQGGMNGLMENVTCRPTQEWSFLTVHTFHTLTHFAVPAAKGCEEPWERLLPPPTHTQCNRHTGRGWGQPKHTVLIHDCLYCHHLILTMGKSILAFSVWILKIWFSRTQGSSYLSIHICDMT